MWPRKLNDAVKCPFGCLYQWNGFIGSFLEHKTCDILAAKRLRLMRFDNRLIIDSLKVVCFSRVRKGKTSIL